MFYLKPMDWVNCFANSLDGRRIVVVTLQGQVWLWGHVGGVSLLAKLCLRSWAEVRNGSARRRPNQMPKPPQLSPFDMKKKRLHSELPLDVWDPHPFCKAEPSSPATEIHSGCLFPQAHCFAPCPELTKGEGWNIHWMVQHFILVLYLQTFSSHLY